jgi:hypothetical protein
MEDFQTRHSPFPSANVETPAVGIKPNLSVQQHSSNFVDLASRAFLACLDSVQKSKNREIARNPTKLHLKQPCGSASLSGLSLVSPVVIDATPWQGIAPTIASFLWAGDHIFYLIS